jgi:virginiamycin B lyase
VTGPDGNIWFCESNANKIGRLTPQGDLTEFAVPTAQATNFFLTVGPDGNIWFTENDVNQIGRVTL